ncbi:MAG: hypothetical protein CMM87_04990 [Rickettsiales bacterium]|nr:hypothetical protein [Rickettsiales bacterium]|tara:strand:- start:10155 stop:10934 length:780 start_codon:yes stop_codon:yes gene_type:complete
MRINQQRTTRSKRMARKKPLLKRWLYIAGLCFIVFLGFFVWSRFDSWMRDLSIFADTLQKKTGFVVEEVLVEGRNKTNKNDLLKTAGISLHSPILSLSLKNTHQQIMSMPWVDQVVIERHLPDTILIRLREHVPYALWQYGQKISLISQEGQEISIDQIEGYRGLPKVVGEGALPKAKQIIETLKKYPEFWRDFHYAQYVGKRRWTIHLKNKLKTKIDLPEKNYIQALDRLKRYEKQHQATRRFRYIDLRLSDKVIVKK